MKLIKLSLQNLFYKPLSLVLSLTLFALGVGLIALMMTLNIQITQKFENNLAGIDLIIGAKGSPLQLVLNGLYHLDAPTGNIPLREVQAFMNPKHPLIKKAVPLSLGDTYSGFRIVGTTADFPELYKAELASGNWWKLPMEVTLGSSVAAVSKLKPGDTFISSHGLTSDDFNKHDHAPFKVIGILKETGTVCDQLVLTSAESIWEVHEHQAQPKNKDTTHTAKEKTENGLAEHSHTEKGDHDESDHDHDAEVDSSALAAREITTLLIQFKARNVMTLNMQRNINQNTQLQAATPAIEINRLFSLMGIGFDAIRALAWVIAFVSGLSIFISLYNSLKERKAELALMRVMGASPVSLFSLIILEGLAIAFFGYILGVLACHLVMFFSSDYLFQLYKYRFDAWDFIREEGFLLAGALSIGLAAAVIPAIQAYRTEIAKTLA